MIESEIHNFQNLLIGGAIFDVPEGGEPWVLFDQDDNELSRGDTLLAMILAAPGSSHTTFGKIKIGNKFTYLEDEWKKITFTEGERKHDGYFWKFSQHDEVESKLSTEKR